MTGGSYSTDCEQCDEEISAAFRYCPHCGEEQPWFTDSEGPEAMTDGGEDPEPVDGEELQVVLSTGDDSAICHGAYTAMNTALTAATTLPADTHVQSATLSRAERVTVDGREYIFREYPARHPGEPRQVEVVPDVDVKQGHRDPRRWRYVFKITDWTDRHRLDEDGIHATLRTIYAPDENSPPADPEGYATVAVNGSVRVPEFIRDAMMDHLEIEGFGRPPFIPGRDGDPVEPEPTAVATDGGQMADVTVYVSEKAGTYGGKTYHTDRNCQYLGNANSVREKSLSVLNGHYNQCSACPDLPDDVPEVLTDGGIPQDRAGHLADEVHDAFLTAREYLRDGYRPEDAADRADIALDLFTDALDSPPEDIRGTNRLTCEGCEERVTRYVSDGGGGYSGDVRSRRGVQGLDIAWCAWDSAGIPVDARPEGWREQRPDDGFPCPNCELDLDTDSLTYFHTGGPEYRRGVRCEHCGSELGGDESE